MANSEIRPNESVDTSAPSEKKDPSGSILSCIDPSKTAQLMVATEQVGTPMFTLESLKEVSRPLSKMIRYVFVKEGVTEELYKQYYNEAADKVHMSTNQRNYSRNNLQRALELPTVTWDTLEKWMVIAQLELTDMSLTYTNHRTGEVRTIKLSDIQHELNEQPYRTEVSIVRDTGVFDELIRQNRHFD